MSRSRTSRFGTASSTTTNTSQPTSQPTFPSSQTPDPDLVLPTDLTINPTMTLPPINLSLDDLRTRMNLFTLRFDEFIDKGRTRLLQSKTDFARTLAEDKERARGMRAQVEYYKDKELEVQKQSAREREEAARAEREIAEMAKKKNSKAEYRAQLLAQIEATEAAIAKKREIRSRERASLATLSAQNAPELAFWEDNLGVRLEGAGVADHLRIVFTHILESDWENEYLFIVNMTTRDYEVVQCRPKLKDEVVRRAVRRLNETRNFAGFLKDMRVGFKALAAEGGGKEGKR